MNLVIGKPAKVTLFNLKFTEQEEIVLIRKMSYYFQKCCFDSEDGCEK